MSVASMLAWRLSRAGGRGFGGIATHVEVKRGEQAIFGDGPYPHKLSEFIGQDMAKNQLLTAMMAASRRGEPMEHTLLASGYPGIGKTALAKIVANMLNVGYVEVGGTVTVKDIRPVLHAMAPGDVLFIDEIHRLVANGKRGIEWMLQLLQDGVIALPTGVEAAPPITIIAATTDAQKLPETILSRFPLQPTLEPYSLAQAVEIAKVTGRKLDVLLEPGQYHRVAAAANYNPRIIGRILGTVRNLQVAGNDEGDVVSTAILWCGMSRDGLTRIAQDYLMLLYGYGGLAGAATLKAALNEAQLDLTEKLLIQKGFIVVTPKGRELTKLGINRAEALLSENPAEEESPDDDAQE